MIELAKVSKIYYMGKIKVQALNNISLKINTGEFITLKGPSGSGKTTLLNVIGALDIPDSGTIKFNNNDISLYNHKQRTVFRAKNLGFIFQNYNLIPELNVYENIEIPLLITKDKHRKKKILEAIEKVGLSNRLKHKPGELSGGQQQRVAIARALIKKPGLILADEPTANLDQDTGKEIIQLMHDLNKLYSLTFIISTHDELLLEKTDRIIKLRDGSLN